MNLSIAALERLVAYYVRHHLKDVELPMGEGVFISTVAERIQEEIMFGTETVREHLVRGNTDEWIELGMIIDETLNPAYLDGVESEYWMTDDSEEMRLPLGDGLGTATDKFIARCAHENCAMYLEDSEGRVLLIWGGSQSVEDEGLVDPMAPVMGGWRLAEEKAMLHYWNVERHLEGRPEL